jgi:hypothetical protein
MHTQIQLRRIAAFFTFALAGHWVAEETFLAGFAIPPVCVAQAF